MQPIWREKETRGWPGRKGVQARVRWAWHSLVGGEDEDWGGAVLTLLHTTQEGGLVAAWRRGRGTVEQWGRAIHPLLHPTA